MDNKSDLDSDKASTVASDAISFLNGNTIKRSANYEKEEKKKERNLHLSENKTKKDDHDEDDYFIFHECSCHKSKQYCRCGIKEKFCIKQNKMILKMYSQVINVNIEDLALNNNLANCMYHFMYKEFDDEKKRFKNYGRFDDVTFSVKKHLMHHDGSHIDRNHYVEFQLPNTCFKYGCVYLIDGLSYPRHYFTCIFENGVYFCWASSANEGRKLYSLKRLILDEVEANWY